jgi:hypothetical protein
MNRGFFDSFIIHLSETSSGGFGKFYSLSRKFCTIHWIACSQTI